MGCSKEQQLYLQANKVYDGVKISEKTVTVMLNSKGVNWTQNLKLLLLFHLSWNK